METDDKLKKEQKATASEAGDFIRIGSFRFSKKVLTALILICFCLIYLVKSYEYISKDTAPRDTDYHFTRSLFWYEYLQKDLKEIRPNEIPFPPVVYLAAQIQYAFRGVSLNGVRYTLLFFSLIFLLAAFGTGYELGGGTGGLAVMALAASSPHVLILSNSFFLDFPVTASVALAFYLILRTRNFTDRTFSLLFGAGMAFAFLTKWSAAFFLIIPFLWFMIPVVFSSKRAILTFTGLLAAGTISFLGLRGYVLNVSALDHLWFRYYLLWVFLPALLTGIVLFLLDRKWKQEENYKKTGGYRMINFGAANLLFIILASPWYLWTMKILSNKFPREASYYRDSALNLKFLISLVKVSVNFAPIFLAVGLIFVFIIKPRRYDRLALPVTILLTGAILWKIVFPEIRYALPIVFYCAVLGGFWTGFTGRARYVLTGIIIIMSLIPIVGSEELNANSFIFERIRHRQDYTEEKTPLKIFLYPKPEASQYNVGKAIDKIETAPAIRRQKLLVFCFPEKGVPFEGEYIEAQAYQRGKRVEPVFTVLSRNYRNDLYNLANDHNMIRVIEESDQILLIHSGEDVDYFIQTLEEIFGSKVTDRETFDVGNGYRITWIRQIRD